MIVFVWVHIDFMSWQLVWVCNHASLYIGKIPETNNCTHHLLFSLMLYYQ